MENAKREFQRFASNYDELNVIQRMVAKTLVDDLPHLEYDTILDLGCGSGAVYNNIRENGIHFNSFIAFDASSDMLGIHPSKNVTKKLGDFNSENFTADINGVDLVISSAALQWSTDLDYTFDQIKSLSNNFRFAIFTSGTFKTLHSTAEVQSPIHPTEFIKEAIDKHFDSADIGIKHYKLEFDTVREMLQYIKKSGVSSGDRKLSVKQIRKLMREYPLGYLEFEVLFAEINND